MSRLLIETIKCLDGRLQNLAFHQRRFDLSRKEKFGCKDTILLNAFVKIPEGVQNGLLRCRVLYAEKIETIEFLPYNYRKVESLKLVTCNSIDYHLKYANREQINQLFEQRGSCDDILIVKNGCITDSFTANPVFWDGAGWWTPDTPLLPGTQRARLIEEGKIKACRITPSDLHKYSKAGLINAMQDLENMPVVEMKNVR